MPTASSLLLACTFAPPRSTVDVAVSGGPDSVGLLLLALEQGLNVTVHHVDHHARHKSRDDAVLVEALAAKLGVPFVLHDVDVSPGGNFESRARSARRATLPAGILTGHTMDDLAETVLLNLLRGAGVDGLSPLVGDESKPLLGVRRSELHEFVSSQPYEVAHDETNESPMFLRNRVRHEVLPLLNDLARRDVVPIVARQAWLMGEERTWLDELLRRDVERALDAVDCRELREWPLARQRRWLRYHLRLADVGDGEHPPSADDVERALSVVRGDVIATEITGGRRLSRSGQYLALSKN
jgi:tRNA(Ile)-lysidine synthase